LNQSNFLHNLGEQSDKNVMGSVPIPLTRYSSLFYNIFAHPYLPPQIYGNCQGEYRVVDERLGISLVPHPLMFSRVLHHPHLLKKVHLGVTPISSLVDDGKKLVPPNLVNFFFLKNKHNNFPLFSHFFQKVFFASPNNPSSTTSPYFTWLVNNQVNNEGVYCG